VSNPSEPQTDIDIDIENGGQPEQDPANPDVAPDATPDENTGATAPAGGTSDAGETRTAERTGSGDAGDDTGENR
jgi:hypothetical protein